MSIEIDWKEVGMAESPVRRRSRGLRSLAEGKTRLARIAESVPEGIPGSELLRRQMAEVLLNLHQAETLLAPTVYGDDV